MKKTLIALATLAAAGTAFAQSTVTISGTLDVAAASVGGDGQTPTNKGTFVNSSRGIATSGINFNIEEDLGGGLRARAFYSIDPRGIINDSTAGIGRHEAFVGLSGAFGNIRLGSINTAALSVMGAAGPFGTATGSGLNEIYLASGGAIRFANSVRYDAPTFVKGLSANVTYAPGNKDGTAAATSGGFGTADSNRQNTVEATDIGLAYTNGPLQVSFSSLTRSALPTAYTLHAGVTSLGTEISANTKTTVNTIAANYTMGALRVFGGVGKGDMGTAAQDNDTTRFGATYTMGAVSLHAQQATLQIGTQAKRKATGVRADYALSKRTTAYVGFEAYDQGSAIQTTSANLALAGGNKRNTTMVGVRHNF